MRPNVKLAEAPSHGKTIFQYAPESRGAADYLELAREIAGEPADAPAAEAAAPVPVPDEEPALVAPLGTAPEGPEVAAP